ncbi:serine/threonine protein kinase [Rippkaea orientalis PCC 8801]|uniref:non-specific serine/threonine protein kinase n=1 Tax=Rippkaea orientalis (strain PCC 8801 / RF-1) TaxID=41431 RepID=B7K1A9_RIPO1|nr:serine/threonine-protein kinase [Rippkaea orientalis]ACK66304.1 serine/threonine protein kinase [Rippkaea orientalis PCC 8801]
MSLCINPHCANPENQDTQLFCQSCGSELLLDGRYRVIEQLGGGGFGKTYEVKDCSLTNFSPGISSSKVLKVLLNNHPKHIELFEREAQFLSRFNHPGIPKVEPDAYFTFHIHKNSTPIHCLVMEKIEGLNLKQYVTQRGKGISQKRAIQWLIQLVVILYEIHNQNFFHRDIKPSNIMLRADGQLVLIDFGTAREVTDTYLSKESVGQVTGLFSAGYSPFEQLNGHAVPQSDFFALGRTFVYLMTSKHPSELYNSSTDELQWHHDVEDLSREFADLLDRIMARSPDQRPQTAAIILQELERLYSKLYGTDSFSTKTPVNLPRNSFSDDSIDPRSLSRLPLPNNAPGGGGPSELDAHFVERCQKELAELIGPMAGLLCQKTLKKNPCQSETEFVRALAQKIPDPQKAQQFQDRILS